MFSRRHAFWHVRWDPTIIMVAHNNRDILMVPYEDLPNEDKDVISKAIEKNSEQVFVVLHQDT